MFPLCLYPRACELRVETADPSASLGMTRRGRRFIESGCWTEAFFIDLGGHRPMTPLSKNISTKGRQHRDLSTALRFGRDDKGKGDPSIEVFARVASWSHRRDWACGRTDAVRPPLSMRPSRFPLSSRAKPRD